MIEPYKRERPAPRTVGILGASGRVFGEANPEVVYVTMDRARAMLVAGEGQAITWNADPIRYQYGDVEAIVIRGDVPDTDRELIDGLVRWRDYMGAHGARIASLGSSAWSLLRASITEPIRTSLGPYPPLRGVVGGRQEQVRPAGTYVDCEHHDLQASYPATLARLRYGGAWSYTPELSSLSQIERLAGAGVPVYVSAEVTLRGDGPGPLPRRPRGRRHPAESILLPVSYPRRGVLHGFWTAPEVVAAASLGHRVKVRDVWAHGSARASFARWWELIEGARGLDGFAGTLGKLTGNALWGQLAISQGDRAILTFRGGRRRVRSAPLGGHGRPRMFDLAEYVTGSVRARLLRELIVPAGRSLIAAHTDGGWKIGRAHV